MSAPALVNAEALELGSEVKSTSSDLPPVVFERPDPDAPNYDEDDEEDEDIQDERIIAYTCPHELRGMACTRTNQDCRDRFHICANFRLPGVSDFQDCLELS